MAVQTRFPCHSAACNLISNRSDSLTGSLLDEEANQYVTDMGYDEFNAASVPEDVRHPLLYPLLLT